MTLEELARDIEERMELLARQMAQLSELLAQLRAVMSGAPPKLMLSPVPTPLPPREPPAVDDEPQFRPGYLDPLVWAEIVKAAPSVGVQPATLAAIQVWESAWYTSRLFREARNVGGIKYRPDLPALGHTLPPYTAADGNQYARFVSWRDGVASHARFLGQKRYDKIRATDDPAAEVLAIHEAGYAEHSQEWLVGVTALAKRFTNPVSQDLMDGWERLTLNFSRAEAEGSARALAQAIENKMPEELLPNARRTAAVLEAVRAVLGRPLHVNSWYRSFDLNRITPGSSPTSAHLRALAADLERSAEIWKALTAARPPEPFLLQVEETHYHMELDKPAGVTWLRTEKKEWES